MIIVVANQKGGCGRSTIAVNFAAALAQQGKDVLLLDADRQATASRWCENRKVSYADKPKIAYMQKYGPIIEPLVDLNKCHDYIIVDVPYGDSVEMRSAMMVCDVVLMPFGINQLDLSLIPRMHQIVKQARQANPKIAAYAFLNMIRTYDTDYEIDRAMQIISEYPGIVPLDSVAYNRDLFLWGPHAQGLGVVETAGRTDDEIAAKNEILELVDETLKNNESKIESDRYWNQIAISMNEWAFEQDKVSQIADRFRLFPRKLIDGQART